MNTLRVSKKTSHIILLDQHTAHGNATTMLRHTWAIIQSFFHFQYAVPATYSMLLLVYYSVIL